MASSTRLWVDVFALPEKSNMAVTESDPDPKVRKLSITFYRLCNLWAEHAGMELKCYWFYKKIVLITPRYFPIWNMFQPLGLHVYSFCRSENDPLWTAVQSLRKHRITVIKLHTVSAPLLLNILLFIWSWHLQLSGSRALTLSARGPPSYVRIWRLQTSESDA